MIIQEIDPVSMSIDSKPSLTIVNDLDGNKCKCGEESELGVHGVRNGGIYSEYYCKACYNKKEKK